MYLPSFWGITAEPMASTEAVCFPTARKQDAHEWHEAAPAFACTYDTDERHDGAPTASGRLITGADTARLRVMLQPRTVLVNASPATAYDAFVVEAPGAAWECVPALLEKGCRQIVVVSKGMVPRRLSSSLESSLIEGGSLATVVFEGPGLCQCFLNAVQYLVEVGTVKKGVCLLGGATAETAAAEIARSTPGIKVKTAVAYAPTTGFSL